MASLRDTVRVQLELPEKSMERLRALKDRTEAVSYAEVIKDAIRLYEDFIKETEADREFYIKDADGKTYPYRVFI